MSKEKFEQYQAIRRKTDDEWDCTLNHFGMAKSQIMIIWTLCSLERPCTQKEICDDWYENKQTINSAAKKLVEMGIVDMAPSPDNFREKLLMLTEKGKFIAMRTVEKMLFAEKKAFSRLSEEEQDEIIRTNRKYYELLKEEFTEVKGENK